MGSRLPTYFMASGTAILSSLPGMRQIKLLEATRLRPPTPQPYVGPRPYSRERSARQTRYAIIANETVMGDLSVAAPITDRDDVAVTAPNVSVPTTRWTVQSAEEMLVHRVQVAAPAISKTRSSRWHRRIPRPAD